MASFNNDKWSLVAIIGVIILLMLYISKCASNVDTRNSQTNLINSLYDSLRTLRLDSSTTVGTIAELQMVSAKQFTDLKIKDIEIAKLQLVVSSYKNKLKAGSSVTNATVDTHIDKTTPNIKDTVYVSSGIRIDTAKLGINTSYSDKWINYAIVSSKDSIKLKLNVTNEYSVVLGYNKRVPFADVINYNPYSTVTKLRAYQVSVPRQKSWGIGFSVGAGFSADLKPRPYVGMGINYNIIKF